MLKSCDTDSIILAEESACTSRSSQANTQQQTIESLSSSPPATGASINNDLAPTVSDNNSGSSTDCVNADAVDQQSAPSLAATQLAKGTLQILEPPLQHVKGLLKELIGKQNKIYIDLLAEKHKLDNAEIVKLQEMMNDVKIYREKLLRIKKQMQNIYQRTNAMKKRAAHIEAYKRKELQQKLQKQQKEEALIGTKPD